MKHALVLSNIDTDLFGTHNPALQGPLLTQIRDALDMIKYPGGIACGTGRRHKQALYLAKQRHTGTVLPVRRSILCGTADFIRTNNIVVLADGEEVNISEYFGTCSKHINPHQFLDDLPDDTLIITDRELIIALGLESCLQPGTHLYEFVAGSAGAHIIA